MKEKMMSAEAVDYFADLAADKSCMLQVMDRCAHTSTQCSFLKTVEFTVRGFDGTLDREYCLFQSCIYTMTITLSQHTEITVEPPIMDTVRSRQPL